MQAFAKPAYLSGFLFYGLLDVAGRCAPGGVRVVSTGVGFFGLVPLSRYLCKVALLSHPLYFLLSSRSKTSEPCRSFQGGQKACTSLADLAM